MKKLFKKPMRKALGLSVALALGSVAMVQAAPTLDNLGDMAIVPYYTVNGNFTSGLHITNTTGKTQAVKVRYHRGSNSDDALDFIVLLSPYDAFTGYVNNERADGTAGLTFRASDNSCTVSGVATGQPISPRTNVADGTEGYITVIGMGQAINEGDLLPLDVLHDSNGNPRNCERAARNFFAFNGTNAQVPTGVGVVDSNQTAVAILNDPLLLTNTRYATMWEDTPSRALRVSYFMRDKTNGLELGNTAEHFENFSDEPMMANQQYGYDDYLVQFGLARGALTGYDFPNLEGGSKAHATPNTQGRFAAVRQGYQASAIINDWSVMAGGASTIATDWVVTFPGQNLLQTTDIPVTYDPVAWNREEGQPTSGGLVVSPDGLQNQTWTMNREANVLTWSNDPSRTAGGVAPVLASNAADEIMLDGGAATNNVNYTNAYDSGNGWARVEFRNHVSHDAATPGNNVYDLSAPVVGKVNKPVSNIANVSGIPVVGFTAWNRIFSDGTSNYGRAVTHSYVRP